MWIYCSYIFSNFTLVNHPCLTAGQFLLIPKHPSPYVWPSIHPPPSSPHLIPINHPTPLSSHNPLLPPTPLPRHPPTTLFISSSNIITSTAWKQIYSNLIILKFTKIMSANYKHFCNDEWCWWCNFCAEVVVEMNTFGFIPGTTWNIFYTVIMERSGSTRSDLCNVMGSGLTKTHKSGRDLFHKFFTLQNK